jgi:hypothetical protein
MHFVYLVYQLLMVVFQIQVVHNSTLQEFPPISGRFFEQHKKKVPAHMFFPMDLISRQENKGVDICLSCYTSYRQIITTTFTFGSERTFFVENKSSPFLVNSQRRIHDGLRVLTAVHSDLRSRSANSEGLGPLSMTSSKKKHLLTSMDEDSDQSEQTMVGCGSVMVDDPKLDNRPARPIELCGPPLLSLV